MKKALFSLHAMIALTLWFSSQTLALDPVGPIGQEEDPADHFACGGYYNGHTNCVSCEGNVCNHFKCKQNGPLGGVYQCKYLNSCLREEGGLTNPVCDQP